MLLLLLALTIGHRVVAVRARVVRGDHTGITLVEHELGRRLLPDFCLLCHLGSSCLVGRGHRSGLLLLQL